MRRLALGLVLAAAAGLLLCGCATVKAADADGFRATAEEIYARYAGSVTSGDQDRWLSNWDENGVQMRPDSQSVVGKKAIEERVRSRWPTMTMTMTIKVEEAAATGDWGYAKGTYVQTITPKGGGAVTNVDGKWLDILKRDADGTWKLYIDCFNSNVPPK